MKICRQAEFWGVKLSGSTLCVWGGGEGSRTGEKKLNCSVVTAGA